MRTAKRWTIVLLAAAGVTAGIFYWWQHGGRDRVLLALQPDFQVAQVDPRKGTLTLRRLNETYIVRCGDDCITFQPGRHYSMTNRGGVLEYTSRHRKIALPIIEQQVNFDMMPGGRG